MTEEKTKKYRKTTKIATPSVGVDGIHNAVRALRAYKGTASYKDLAKGADLHPVYMSQSLSASKDIGLTEYAGKRGYYQLTPDGGNYARYLSYGEESKCKELMKRLILENPLWSEILRFLRMSKGEARDPLLLVGDIEGKLGKSWKPSMRNTYANAYTSILEFAGLIEVEGSKMISQVEFEAEKEVGEEPTKEPQEKAFLPTTPEGYAELSISDSFKVFVKKNVETLEFFQDQIKEDSIFARWIDHEKRKLKKNSEKQGGQTSGKVELSDS